MHLCGANAWSIIMDVIGDFGLHAGREKLQRSVLHVREGNASEPITGMAFTGAADHGRKYHALSILCARAPNKLPHHDPAFS